MEKMNIKKAIIFDGTQVSQQNTWDRDFIVSLQTRIKKTMISKYGQQSIDDDFQLVVFTLAKTNENNMMQIKLDSNGIEECNWLTSILEQNYNQFPCDCIIDETGTFMDGTIVLCDYWWRNLDTKILSRYAISESAFDSCGRINTSIIDKIFELAMNNPSTIFIPYDLYVLENSYNYAEERKKEESTVCRVVYPFTFSGDKCITLLDFEDLIFDDFPSDLLLVEDKNRTTVKKLINTRNRQDSGHVKFI